MFISILIDLIYTAENTVLIRQGAVRRTATAAINRRNALRRQIKDIDDECEKAKSTDPEIIMLTEKVEEDIKKIVHLEKSLEKARRRLHNDRFELNEALERFEGKMKAEKYVLEMQIRQSKEQIEELNEGYPEDLEGILDTLILETSV